MKSQLIQYQKEASEELGYILRYWDQYVVDTVHGGFYGEVSGDNAPDIFAQKGSVLNARILWTFSRAYNYSGDEYYLSLATRAYRYITDYFIDKECGGVYWSVSAKGDPVSTKKQIYAQAFCIYALSEYCRAAKDEQALGHAVILFELIEQYSSDKTQGGYFEAFSRNWKYLRDMRLSDKDQNDAKTMNTHLHIVEAYASLYGIWKNDLLKKRIEHLLDCFCRHIIDAESNHLILFFDKRWKANCHTISFGHDIEAAWLLQQCAESIEDEVRTIQMKRYAVSIANAALEGRDHDGGLFYEKEKKLIGEKHWWPQAEAMVGLLNAYQVSGSEKYLQQSLDAWRFIKTKIKSPTGEWIWGVDESGDQINNYYKAGLWKCPYHNGRACMEVVERIRAICQKTKN